MFIPEIAALIETVAVVVIIIGLINVFKNKYFSKKRPYFFRGELLKVFESSLEIMLAAEIIRTVVIKNSIEIITILGIIVLRVGLSLIIHFEMNLYKKERDH
jgi:uncharacterized membrane protein